MKRLLLICLALACSSCNQDSSVNTNIASEKLASQSQVSSTVAASASSIPQAESSVSSNPKVWPSTTQANPTCPKEITNVFECNRHIEAAVARIYPGLFLRKGINLEIKLSSGNFLRITDVNGNEFDKNHYTSFIKYFPEIQYGLLSVDAHEWSTYDLINVKTGKQTNVGGMAELSPDNRRLAIFNCSIAEFSPCILSVYFITENDISEEFKIEPNDWQPGNLHWIDGKQIEFDELSVDPMHPHEEKHNLRFLVEDVHKTGRWELR
jgi:hypothetical protein